MPVPTIATVSPTSGHPTGGQLIEITGTNFQLPPAPPATGVVPEAPPTVRVTIGGGECARVAVVSATRLLVTTPKYSLPVGSGGATASTATVNVVVENIDANGDLIPTETVTAANAFTYRRPDLSGTSLAPVTQLVRHLVTLMRSEVMPEVITHQSTDYDSDVSTLVVDSAKLPTVILTGPRQVKNTLFTDGAPGTFELDVPTEYAVHRRRLYCDLIFDVVLITNSDMHLFNAIGLITTVVDRNPKLTLDLGAPFDTMRFDLEWDEVIGVQPQSAQLNSNIRTARGVIKVVGFPYGPITGVEDDAVLDVGGTVEQTPTLEAAVQMGDNLPAYSGMSVRSPTRTREPQ